MFSLGQMAGSPVKPAGVGQQALQLMERNVHAVLAHGRGALIAFQVGIDDGRELSVALHHAHQGLERRLLALERNLCVAVGAAVMWCWGDEPW